MCSVRITQTGEFKVNPMYRDEYNSVSIWRAPSVAVGGERAAGMKRETQPFLQVSILPVRVELSWPHYLTEVPLLQ